MHSNDTFKHQGLRKRMVEDLHHGSSKYPPITDKRVLEAMLRVPRHLFLEGRVFSEAYSVFDETAYENKAFQIGNGQTISMPFTVAYQSQLLELVQGDKVLEIGTGSGYQAAVLAELGVKVFTIERQKLLFDRTPKLLKNLGYNSIKTFFGDGFLGVPAFAPYDKIIITAAAPEIPKALMQQLMIGGQMVIPLTEENDTRTIMRRITRIEENEFLEEQFLDCAFVPMLKGVNR